MCGLQHGAEGIRVKRLIEMVLQDAGHRSKDHSSLDTNRAASRLSRHWTQHSGHRAQKSGLLMVENGSDYCILCTFFCNWYCHCNAAFIQCVNYFVCPVDPDKLMMSNVYTVFFFICDVYLSKVSQNETETVDWSVCFIFIYHLIYLTGMAHVRW